MEIQSTRFGTLTLSNELMLHFSEGLPGFSEEKQFVFLKDDFESPFAYLQSVQDKDLTLLLVDPFSFFKHYSFELEEVLMEQLNVSEDKPPHVYSIVKVPEKAEEMTTNLTAPIVINWEKQIATQVILDKSPYSKNQRLFPFGLPKVGGKK